MKVSQKNYKFLFSSTTFRLNLRDTCTFFISYRVLLFKLLLIVPLILILTMFFILFNTGCSILASKGLNIYDKYVDDINTQDKKTEDMQNPENAIDTGQITEESREQIPEETESAVLEEETGIVSDEEITINIYYADSIGEYLIGEARTLSGSGKYVDAIFEMMKDPIDSSLNKLIPETTRINGVKVAEGIAKVDLSQEFIDDRFISDVIDMLLVYSIVNTLTEFKEINSVEFFINGEKLNSLGQFDLEEPLFRRSDLIKG
ncbi:MAG: GerMN domain-containing protein [Actinobacteria bacterium]|nr:GerMN domain-containing protein [Actinomycetota bacterium]